MRLEKLGKPVAVKFEQLGVGARANRGRARLTRHQRHLAKEGRPREIADMDLATARGGGKDFDRAAADYVERIAIVTFADDHFAAAEFLCRHTRQQQAQLLVAKVAQEVDLPQLPENFAFERLRFRCERLLPLQSERPDWERNLYLLAPERVPEARGDSLARTVSLGVVAQPVSDAIAYRRFAVLPCVNLGRRALQHTMDVAQRFKDHFAHEIRRCVVTEPDCGLVSDDAVGVVYDHVLSQHRGG